MSFARFHILCNHKCFTVDVNLIGLLRNSCTEEYETYLATSNTEEYISLLATDETSENRVTFKKSIGLAMLEEQGISLDSKLALLDFFDTPIKLDGNYPDSVNMAIMEAHFDESDIGLLPLFYSTAEAKFRKGLIDASVNHIDALKKINNIIDNKMLVEVLRKLASSDNTRSDRLELIASQLLLDNSPLTNRKTIKKCFDAGDLADYSKLTDGKQIGAPLSAANAAMANALIHRGMSSEKGARSGASESIIVSPKGYKRASRKK